MSIYYLMTHSLQTFEPFNEKTQTAVLSTIQHVSVYVQKIIKT